MLKLTFVSGPNAGTEFVLETEFAYIGREIDNTVVIDDAKLSRYHFCVAVAAAGGYEVTDNKSTNGTYLNGARLEVTLPLKTGDEIQVGNSVIKIDVSGAAQAAAPDSGTGNFSIQSADGSFETQGDYITAGRSADNHVHLDDQKASREHAHFVYRDGTYFLKDNGSVNGTYLNDKRIVEEPINAGDVARIGPFQIKFAFPSPRLLQITVIAPSVEEEFGVEAANQVDEQEEKQEQKIAEYDVPKAAQDAQVMDYIPKEGSAQGGKQRYATLMVDAIPKAVLEAGKEAKEEKRKVPAWVATSDVLNDGRRRYYIGGSVAAALVLTMAMLLTGFTRPFMNRPLSKYHQSEKFYAAVKEKNLGSDCQACHTSFSGVNTENCKVCHEVKFTVFGEKHQKNANFNDESKKRGNREECLACHFEHAGVDIEQVKIEDPKTITLLEKRCLGCHKHETPQHPEGIIERGYHDKNTPKYTPDQIVSQDTGMPFMPKGPDGAILADAKPYPKGAPGLDSKSFASENIAVWVGSLHKTHGEVPGYCNACHGPREIVLNGTKTIQTNPKQACLDCHQVDREASCMQCHDQHQGVPVPGGVRDPEIKASASSQIPGGVAGGAMVLLLFIPALVVFMRKRKAGELIPVNQVIQADRAKLKKIQADKDAGKFQKVTVIIKKELCIGCSGCVNSCPYDVLEIDPATHKSSVTDMDRCLGDMRCTKACPTGACIVIIGDKIPEVEQVTIDEFHESNVKGLYVIGEGCGKPLIKNAINHGKISIDHVASQPDAKGSADPNVYDVIVVGSGPGGLSAGLAAKEQGLKYLVLEKSTDSTDTIRNFPKAKVVLAEPVSIPLAGKLWMEDTNKETLIAKWEEIIKKTGLEVTMNHEVTGVSKSDNLFVVQTPKATFKAKRVILAPGTRGAPNKIGCPGEDAMHPTNKDARVQYRLTDTDPFKKKHCLVLGGGDSAVEAARSLTDVGAIVTLAYRKEKFDRIKERNLEETLKYVKGKKMKLYLLGNCKEVKLNAKGQPIVVIKHEKGAAGANLTEFLLTGKPGEDEVPNDYVFALLGAAAPSKFFKGCGIEVKKVPMA
jgi:thioredoxin reductase (NADPH)